jgi:hypothetical protein
MPYRMKKNKDGTYDVDSPTSKRAKHTTKAKAKSQIRLLNAVEHGWKPTGKKKKARKAKGSKTSY